MICVIYLITAIHPSGIHFWETPIASLVPGGFASQAAEWVDELFGLKGGMSLASLPVNVAFMIFGAFGTVGNIIGRSAPFSHNEASLTYNSYSNVITARRKAGKPILEPLQGYLPFALHTTILVVWLQAERRGGASLVHDARLLPFLGYWGMAYVTYLP